MSENQNQNQIQCGDTANAKFPRKIEISIFVI